MLDNAVSFFKSKRPWSKYKDLILNYYLEPYLYKVATLGKPIVVADCFAGPGRFGDGEIGSPLIILKRLASLHQKGMNVSAFFIEERPDFYQDLIKNTSDFTVPHEMREGTFREHVKELAALAKFCTMFVYLDPFKPEDLRFHDFQAVYDMIKSGQSIETLINFMSSSFLRAVSGIRQKITQQPLANKSLIRKWNEIAGGDYWQKILLNDSLSNSKKVDEIAKGYQEQLGKIFLYILSYPIRERYAHKFPKYHLIFGTRQTDAIDLMNRAMVKARREFVGAQFIKNMLFDNQPQKEVIDEKEIAQWVVSILKITKKCSWKSLRIQITLTYPCKYTDSEINQSIKKLIRNAKICSDCNGTKIQEDATVWL